MFIHKCFNTQPPEGGWKFPVVSLSCTLSFNTQPPEDGWNGHVYRQFEKVGVSTHSRPKTAGLLLERFSCGRMFQHTAARRRLVIDTMSNGGDLVSTHSRLKAAGCCVRRIVTPPSVSTHSRLKAAGHACCRLYLR